MLVSIAHPAPKPYTKRMNETAPEKDQAYIPDVKGVEPFRGMGAMMAVALGLDPWLPQETTEEYPCPYEAISPELPLEGSGGRQ